MAASLQGLLDTGAPPRLAALVCRAWPDFDTPRFLAQAAPGYEALSLMQRGQRLADALAATLPGDFARAAPLLAQAMDPPLPLDARGEPGDDGRGYSAFLYLPYSLYIARHGLAQPDTALALMHALTQRFTAEFCLRPFLRQHREVTLARLHAWASDPSAHVRRLVSEGTRPRLPWAPRLAPFVADPAPGLALLERLRDDPSSYVRRSVANHLGDIGKDHPERLFEVATRWLADAPPARAQLVRHALRLPLRRGDPRALALDGAGHATTLQARAVRLEPACPCIGGAVELRFDLHNPGPAPQRARLDLEVHYVGAGGTRRPRVFSWRSVVVDPGAAVTLARRLSLRQMSTRTHHPGRHTVALRVNGRPQPLGHFDLQAGPTDPPQTGDAHHAVHP